MAQLLNGHDVNGNILDFDRDGDRSTIENGKVEKMDSVFFVNVARLLSKDEIKKGSFKVELMTGSAATGDSATATITVDDAGQCLAGSTISVVTTAGDTVTITGHASANAMADTTGGSTNGTFDASTVSGGSTNNTAQALAIATVFNLHDDITATAASAVVTITQSTGGTAGNTTISTTDESGGSNGGSDMSAAMTIVNFSGGAAGKAVPRDNNAAKILTLQDHDGTSNYRVDSPAGEYGLLYSASADAGTSGKSLGHIYYQAGVAVVTSSVFRHNTLFDTPYSELDDDKTYDSNESVSAYDGASHFGYLPASTLTTEDTSSVEACMVSASISASAGGFRSSIYNMEFNNTTELNSTIYFCRASHNEFNYSSNPTYVDSTSKIRVKESSLDQPVAYVTTIGLYSADNELLAVAKLSEPIKKTPETELTFRVRIDY